MNSKLTKLLALALALVMVLGLFAGCGKKAEEPAPEVPTAPKAAPARKEAHPVESAPAPEPAP